ncbi:MAG: hypothetical protein ACK40P_07480, partial [Pseudanabaena sp.]
MTKRNWATRPLLNKYFLHRSLKLTATLLLGASQLLESALAQPVILNPPIQNTANYTYTEPATGNVFFGVSQTLQNQLVPSQPLIDPFGRLTNCDGGLLPNYTGFSVGLYEPLNAVGDIGAPISLTATVPPNQAGANKSVGIEPNFFNANPFFLTNSDQGKYSFLLDPNRGQVSVGSQYILAVKPPANSSLGGRRIRIVITARNGDILSYSATSLDGNPISSTNGQNSINGTFNIGDAAAVGLSLAIVNLNLSICDAQSIQILKTGDRAAAQPGDVVVYRLAVKNLANTEIRLPEIRDDLPVGFQYVNNSVRAELGGASVPIAVSQNGRTLTF